MDGRGNILFLNAAFEKASGYEREELIEKNLRDLIAPESYAHAEEVFRKQLAGEELGVFELSITKRDGGSLILETREKLIWKDRRIVEVHGVGRNVTQRKEAERRLTESERRYRLLVDKANDVIYQADTNGRFILFNAMAVRLTGYSEQEIMAKHYLDIIHPDFRRKVRRFYGIQFVKGKSDTYLETPILTRAGGIVWLGQNVQLMRDGEKIVGFQAIARDITDRKEAEDALRESELKYRTIIENIEEGYYEVDLAGNFTFFNDSMVSILEYPREVMLGMNNRAFMDSDTARRVFGTFHDVYVTGKPARALDWELIRADGSRVFVGVSVSLITDPMGRPIGFRGIARDITERKKFEEELKRLSITDDLTGLFNQRHFYRRIEEEARRARRMDYPLCVILFDLDNFKSYNDTYGHLAGNDVLKEIGAIVRSCIREDMDTAFRYGGDEFAVILPAIPEQGAREVAGRIRAEVIRKIQGIDVSIGIASLGENFDVTDIIHRADSAMYRQKERHRSPGSE
jgi:diguanylate cyclase (GGDEF)-like protein/PAS domain S-box-containing protein